MKQSITKEQIDSQNIKNVEKLYSWMENKGYGKRGIFTLGHLIDFLYNKRTVVIHSEERESPMMGWYVGNGSSVELVDAIVIEIKDILKYEN